MKAQLFAGSPLTEGAGFFLGRGERGGDVVPGGRPTPKLLDEVAIPALLGSLENYEADTLASSILIALARIGAEHPSRADEIAAAITPFMTSASQELAETAVCAIGILGNPRSSLALSEILLDSPEGRRLVGSTSGISTRTRAFAAFGLGLLGRRTDNEDVRRLLVHRLVAAYRNDETRTPDLRVACVLGISVVPLAYGPEAALSGDGRSTISFRQEQLRFLALALGDRRGDRRVRAHAASAIPRLLEVEGEERPSEELVHDMVRQLLARIDKKAPRELVQACVQAIGLLVDADSDDVDRRARRALLSIERNTGDQLARNLALVSLARIAARAEDTAEGGEVLDQLRSHLLGAASRLRSARGRWGVLGLGILSHAQLEQGRVPHSSIPEALRIGLGEVGGPLDISAYSVACGMVRDPGCQEALLRKMNETADDRARGFLALGLGMLGAHEALPQLREVVRASTYRPNLLQEASLAIALLADRDATSELVERLRATRSLAAQASLARALGRIGDASTLQPLADMLGDDSVTPVARSFAAAALGRVADTARLPWNTIYSLDVAYGASTATLFDTTGFGILNLL